MKNLDFQLLVTAHIVIYIEITRIGYMHSNKLHMHMHRINMHSTAHNNTTPSKIYRNNINIYMHSNTMHCHNVHNRNMHSKIMHSTSLRSDTTHKQKTKLLYASSPA